MRVSQGVTNETVIVKRFKDTFNSRYLNIRQKSANNHTSQFFYIIKKWCCSKQSLGSNYKSSSRSLPRPSFNYNTEDFFYFFIYSEQLCEKTSFVKCFILLNYFGIMSQKLLSVKNTKCMPLPFQSHAVHGQIGVFA